MINLTPEQSKLLEKIGDFISNKCDVDKAKIVPDAHLKDDLGLDSLDRIEIMFDLEEDFDIIIEDDDAKKFRTIADIIQYLTDKGIE